MKLQCLYSTVSVTLSMFCIFMIMLVNVKIANQYIAADGKTQALFGIVEILKFSYKYWFVLLSFGAVGAAVAGRMKNSSRVSFTVSMFWSIVSMITVFVTFWKYMVFQ